MKKWASKVAHNRPRPFYSTVQPRIDFSYYEISGPDICSLICEKNSLGKIKEEKRSGTMPRKITKKLEPSTFGNSAVGRPENFGGKVMEGHLKKTILLIRLPKCGGGGLHS